MNIYGHFYFAVSFVTFVNILFVGYMSVILQLINALNLSLNEASANLFLSPVVRLRNSPLLPGLTCSINILLMM